MKHFASSSFWDHYEKLPRSVQELAKRNFDLLKKNPEHPIAARQKGPADIGPCVLKDTGLWQWKSKTVWSGSGLGLIQITTSLCSSSHLCGHPNGYIVPVRGAPEDHGGHRLRGEAPALSPDEKSLYYHKQEGGVFVICRVARETKRHGLHR